MVRYRVSAPILVRFCFAAIMLIMLCTNAHAQFYVSPSGLNTNPGTLAAPFKTIAKCQSAMQGSGDKTCVIRAGSYSFSSISNCNGDGFTCGIVMTSADNGETFTYYAPDGVNTAVLSGGSTRQGNGLFVLFSVDGTSNVTINGLAIANFQFSGIFSVGGTSYLTITNNKIYNGYYVPGSDSNPNGIGCYGCSNLTISHNVIYDIAAFGISIVVDSASGNIDNLLIDNNVLYNTCTGLADCSAIYAQDIWATSTNLKWTNNYVLNGNTYAALGSSLGAALYADDCLSNLTATGNVITGQNGSNTITLHGGSNDVFTGNITDLSTYAQNVMAFQTSTGNQSHSCNKGTMSGNKSEHNLVAGNGGGGGYYLISGTPVNYPTITDNDYYAYGNGGPISSSGINWLNDNEGSDSNPSALNPAFTSMTTYALPSTSPVYSAPVSFPTQPSNWGSAGFWGPPGFVVP